jgi:Fe-S cluster assembly ATPase SufC
LPNQHAAAFHNQKLEARNDDSTSGARYFDLRARILKDYGQLDLLKMNELMDRDINYGFSGGEIKRSELLQLIAQSPELVLLDEPESGVDLVNMSLIGR